jgi:hypothetical protein
MQNDEACSSSTQSLLEQEVSADSQENQHRINTEKRVNAWIQYILSREFHGVFETSISVFKRVNLNKKDITEWTNEERCFITSPLPARSLVRFHLPLTSLCQRIQVYTEKRTAARNLLSLFQEILDISSIKTQLVDNLKHSVEPLAEDVQCKSDENTQMDDAAVYATIFRKKELSDTDITKNVSESLMSEIETSRHRVPSWTLCKTWEPCSIGTLPGYIS